MYRTMSVLMLLHEFHRWRVWSYTVKKTAADFDIKQLIYELTKYVWYKHIPPFNPLFAILTT